VLTGTGFTSRYQNYKIGQRYADSVKDDGIGTGATVVIIIASVFALFIILGVIIYCCCKVQKYIPGQDEENHKELPSPSTPLDKFQKES